MFPYNCAAPAAALAEFECIKGISSALPGDRLIRLHFVNYSLAGTNYNTILRASGHLYKIIQILKFIL